MVRVFEGEHVLFDSFNGREKVNDSEKGCEKEFERDGLLVRWKGKENH